MKTISGSIISSKPLSLSEATKILSKFVSISNGASPANSVYLRRASESFEELNQFNKEVRKPKSGCKSKKPFADSGDFRDRSGLEEDLNGKLKQIFVNGDHKSAGSESEKKKEKNRKKHGEKSKDGEVVDSSTEDGGRDGRSEASFDKKCTESNGVEEGTRDNNSSKKNKNKKGMENNSLRENGVEGLEGKLEEAVGRKKRKSAEIAEGEPEDGAIEHSNRGTKRRKGGD